jgi:glucosamine-6-phosphate deaminase
MKSDFQLQIEKLRVYVLNNRQDMGMAAGTVIAQVIRELLDHQKQVTMIFAAAPSQIEFLTTLREEPGIDWSRVVAFHLDEYVGLSDGDPQTFKSFLKDQFFDRVHPGKVFYLQSETTNPGLEAERYEALLRQYKIDVACIGIGENGHIAFNDPHNANFFDPRLVKVVTLAEESRLQQVHDHLFDSLDAVPEYAMSITIPAILSSAQIYCMVPAVGKAQAVRDALIGPVSTACPASILRQHPNTRMYLDMDAASLLLKEIRESSVLES